MEPEISMPYLQVPATCPYPELSTALLITWYRFFRLYKASCFDLGGHLTGLLVIQNVNDEH
jgi:hypothetical protein